MIPKDKATELVGRNIGVIIFGIKQNIKADTVPAAKQLAINTANEVINSIEIGFEDYISLAKNSYWEEVKQEIEKL
jgi:hypothetical protein